MNQDDNRKKYRIRYYQKNTTTKSVQFNRKTDKDIIDAATDPSVNFQGYVKELIRRDLSHKENRKKINKYRIAREEDE